MAEIRLIEDGYNQTIKARGRLGLYPDFAITIRPMTYQQRKEAFRKLESLRAEAYDPAVFALMADRIVEWDLASRPTPEAPLAAMPILPDRLAKLPAALSERLFQIVCGFDGGDEEVEDSRKN